MSAYSSQYLPGLFHPGCTLGILPFRGFPSQGDTPPSRCAFAFVTFFPKPPDGHGTHRCWAPPSHASRIRGGALLRLQGLCPPVSPCAPKTAFTVIRASFPSWAFPSLRCSPQPEIERISPLVLSRAFTNPSLESCPSSLWPVGTPECPSPVAVALSLSRPPDRSEVSRR